MTKDEALKLALEALKRTGNIAGFAHEREQAVIAAIDEVLAQPVQEPVAWEQLHEHLAERYFCQRCGKPVNLTTIHTCTPPREKNT